jgi:arylsulfatase
MSRSEANARPNVLFIMADQHRADHLGSAGASHVRTPNLDRLAARGVRFGQCYTNCPICAPARIGLATGLQPSRLGSLDNSSYLPHSVPTYYQRFRDHGYRVGCVGKLDLAKPSGYNGRYGDRPCVYGWGFTHPEECEGKMHAGSSPTPLGPYTHYLEERGLLQAFYEDYSARKKRGWILGASHDSVLPTEAFEDAYVGRRAAQWLEQVPDDFPWYYFVSFVGPHDPFDPPTEYASHFRHAEMPPAIADDMRGKPSYLQHRVLPATPEQITMTRRQYCASIELIDDQVGLMLTALERRGRLDDTYIVFTSDHGEMLGDHGLYTKSVPYDGAVRIPLIVAGPGIAGGRTSEALIELIDVHPTLCDLAGLPQQEHVDARSFASLLHEQRKNHQPNGEHRPDVLHRPDIVTAIRNFRSLRTQHYALIENYNDVTELYDLEADPQELHNIAAQHPDLVRELAWRLNQRFTEGRWLR